MQSIAEYYRVLIHVFKSTRFQDYNRVIQSITKCDSVSQSTTEYDRVLKRIAEYCSVPQSITEYYRALQSITEYYKLLPSITDYYRVLQSTTEYYRVFLAHLLGPIFGLVLYMKQVIRMPSRRRRWSQGEDELSISCSMA